MGQARSGIALTADVIAFSVRPVKGLSVLLIRRRFAPHRGKLALPGGFVEEGEDLEKAARREFLEETGVSLKDRAVHQLKAYGAPKRDPRHRTVTVAYVVVLGPDVEPVAGDDAASAEWCPVAEIQGTRRLAFDHATILADGLEWVSDQLEGTTLACSFLPSEFTLSDLREVYEAVWDRDLDAGNFQRKIQQSPGLIEDTGLRTTGGRGRPATVYRAGGASRIRPAMSRENV